ncbi:cation-binding protein [Neisseria sp. N95_16]|uniref:Hemerythrin domain-containing protein n=1 Tax=Neisseria brasiliensis TaxID=2666100 RepID=A0A5Q3RZ42_9NEIS|nr:MULTISPECIES: hemerythrin domain-containing protein [Neisseria]MRN37524.1 hemerythrin domain-containing protein [Neisseria brasiliensis]PJO09981.1 cation-binding protein [Neisseria sp. N95_16]PJO79347.1 cation-binding protein [Neisseria sp. N177_16]QGL24513.1 hemerythrin domain-containing protein [Neisseria brasiliensis]
MNPFNTQSVTFAEPIDMLYACHDKVRRFCSQVKMLPEYIAENGRNDVVLQATRQISQYFNVAAPLHHEDEEENFFPLLLQYAPQAQESIDELLRQHESLHANWSAVAEEFARLEEDADYPLNTDVLQRFTAGYDVHLDIEEPLFEMGKTFIPKEKLTEIGEIMAARRRK